MLPRSKGSSGSKLPGSGSSSPTATVRHIRHKIVLLIKNVAAVALVALI